MIFRRRKSAAARTAAPWPAQGVGFRIGLAIGRLSNYLAGWSRQKRAGLVVGGMAIAIPLFWLGRPGWAVLIGGFVSLMFWLSLPTDTAPPQDSAGDLHED